MALEDKPFSISVTGETSQELFRGDFRAKTALTMRDNLIADARRRELLGTLFGNDPSPLAATIAAIVGDLTVRLTLSATWLKEANLGLDLVDQNVLQEIYEKATGIEIEARAERAKKSEADRVELTKEVTPALTK